MSVRPDMVLFSYAHLPENLQDVSARISDLANHLNDTLPDCTEKDFGLRKLLEAKDCFVRARLTQLRTSKEQR